MKKAFIKAKYRAANLAIVPPLRRLRQENPLSPRVTAWVT
jgi:hypothetical protein